MDKTPNKISYKMMDRHFILTGAEWDFWRASMPQDELNKTFHNRVLLSPVATSDIQGLTAQQIIDVAYSKIKEILYDLNLNGVVGIFQPEIIQSMIVKERDIFRSISFSVFFQNDVDYDNFKSKVGRSTGKALEEVVKKTNNNPNIIWRGAFTIDTTGLKINND